MQDGEHGAPDGHPERLPGGTPPLLDDGQGAKREAGESAAAKLVAMADRRKDDETEARMSKSCLP